MTQVEERVTKARQGRVIMEPSERWVRIQFNGEWVADSRNVLLVWDNHHIPVYFFPVADVRQDYLRPTGSSQGERTTYHVTVKDRTAENAARRYTNPAPEHEALKEYITFRWSKMDHWYEEAEEVFVHPRDPYTRVDAIPSSRHVRVVIGGVTVAETERPVLLFETHLPTRYYLPPEDIQMALLEPTNSYTRCPYKGIASYWSAHINGQVYPDIVWSYPEPIPECPKIKGLLSFYNEKVDLYVDGVLQERPRTSWSS